MTAQTIIAGGALVGLVLFLLLKLWRDRARDPTPPTAALDETAAAIGPEAAVPFGPAPSPPATAAPADTPALAEVMAAAERVMVAAEWLLATLEAGAPDFGISGAGGSPTTRESLPPSADVESSAGCPAATDARQQAVAAAAAPRWVDDEIVTAPGWPVPGESAVDMGEAPTGSFAFPRAGGTAEERGGISPGCGDPVPDAVPAAPPTDVSDSAVRSIEAMSEAEKPSPEPALGERPAGGRAPLVVDEAFVDSSGGPVGASLISQAPGGAPADLGASPGWDPAGDLASRAAWDPAAPDHGDAGGSAKPRSSAGDDPGVAGELPAADRPVEAAGDDTAELDWSPTASGLDDAPWSLSKTEIGLDNGDERALTPFEAEVDQWVAAAAEWQQPAATDPSVAAARTPARDEAELADSAGVEGPEPGVAPVPSVQLTDPEFPTPAAPAVEETAATTPAAPAEERWDAAMEETRVAWWDEREVEEVDDDAGSGSSVHGEPALQPAAPVVATVAGGPSHSPAGSCLTIAEAAQWLSVDHKTVRRMIDRGEIRAMRIGRVFRIEQGELRQALAYRSTGRDELPGRQTGRGSPAASSRGG